jgi:hypothetical protein
MSETSSANHKCVAVAMQSAPSFRSNPYSATFICLVFFALIAPKYTREHLRQWLAECIFHVRVYPKDANEHARSDFYRALDMGSGILNGHV